MGTPRYKLDDFQESETVCYIHNSDLRMTVIGKDEINNKLKCRWISGDGTLNERDLFLSEVDKNLTWEERAERNTSDLLERYLK